MKVYGVIMAGGGGTRFWPLSRHKEPKQLLNLSLKGLMINETIDRVAEVCNKSDIFIVTNADQVEQMIKVTRERVDANHILCEPVARNTSACIGYAAFEIIKKYGDGIMCIFPSDHIIKDDSVFKDDLKAAVEAAEDDSLVTIGITPTFPCTGYGYIRYNKSESGVAKPVIEFKEKPNSELAQSYVASGEYVWNSGIFVWKASVILRLFKEFLPDIYSGLEQIADTMGSEMERAAIEHIYPRLPAISIDYGIMEKCDCVKVIPSDMMWNDIGSWDNLGAIYDADINGNIFVGDHVAIDTNDCITYSNKRLISTIGVDNLIIVETDDAILICDKNRAQDVKMVVDKLKADGREDLL